MDFALSGNILHKLADSEPSTDPGILRRMWLSPPAHIVVDNTDAQVSPTVNISSDVINYSIASVTASAAGSYYLLLPVPEDYDSNSDIFKVRMLVVHSTSGTVTVGDEISRHRAGEATSEDVGANYTPVASDTIALADGYVMQEHDLSNLGNEPGDVLNATITTSANNLLVYGMWLEYRGYIALGKYDERNITAR